MNKVVLVTGASGFLGASIVKALVHNKCQVIGLKRQSSNLWRCAAFRDQVRWVDTDAAGWLQELSGVHVDVIIHSAWTGVGAAERNDWHAQMGNVNLLLELLEFGKQSGIKQFIGLGSQAEYGYFEGKIDESFPANPNSAYGVVKLLCSQLLQHYAVGHNMKWYWLRLFSFFGEQEATNWFIPSVITKLQQDAEMDFTPGEQKYAYMYVADLAAAILQLVNRPDMPESGIYNLSSNAPQRLRDIVTRIRKLLKSNTVLNFGAMDYRPGQSMHIEGDTTRFENNVGPLQHSDFEEKLASIIDYYKTAVKDEGFY